MPKPHTNPPSRRSTRARKQAEARRRRARALTSAVVVAGVVTVVVIVAQPASAQTYNGEVATGTVVLSGLNGGPSETLSISGSYTHACDAEAEFAVTGDDGSGTYTISLTSRFDHRDRFGRWWYMVVQVVTSGAGNYTGHTALTTLDDSNVVLGVWAYDRGGNGMNPPSPACTQGTDNLDCVIGTTGLTLSGLANSDDVTAMTTSNSVYLSSNTSQVQAAGGNCASDTWKSFVCACGQGRAVLNNLTVNDLAA